MTTINDTGMALSKRMRTVRLLAGLEQQDMADRLGVARTTVSAWERGATEPSATNFVGWALITGQPLEWLAEGVVRPKGLEPLTFWTVNIGNTKVSDFLVSTRDFRWTQEDDEAVRDACWLGA